MTKERKLSLPVAILININIMLGAGIFLNTVKLSKLAGALSSFSYIIIGLLMLPLVISIAKLTGMYPDGGFYAFGKNEISPFAGFLSAWGYLIGKLGSGALMAYFSLKLIQHLIPVLSNINTLTLCIIVIIGFVLLNMLNIKAGGKIQTGFTILKLVPITFAILVGLFLFDPSNLSSVHRIWEGIPSSLPLLFYAAMGFEAACVLSCKIENPSKNAPKAIIMSYVIAISIAAIYQFMFYGALGTALSSITQTPGYLHAFPTLLKKLLPALPKIALYLQAILHLALASSALGGSYGIMFSNTWNLFTIAQNKHTFFSNFFTKFNKHAIPFACVIFIGVIYITYLLVSGGDQMHLQPMSSLGVVFAYTLSVLALFIAKLKRSDVEIPLWVPTIGLVNCGILIYACTKTLIERGLSSLVTFMILMALGSIMFFISAMREKARTSPI